MTNRSKAAVGVGTAAAIAAGVLLFGTSEPEPLPDEPIVGESCETLVCPEPRTFCRDNSIIDRRVQCVEDENGATCAIEKTFTACDEDSRCLTREGQPTCVPVTWHLASVVAPCGSLTAPGLQHLPGQAQARCRAGRRAPECVAAAVPDDAGLSDVPGWRVVQTLGELPESPCVEGDTCRRPMVECNRGFECIAGFVQELLRPGDDEGAEPVWKPVKFGLCCSDRCRCAEEPCVTGALRYHLGEDEWQEVLCGQHPEHRRCVEGEQ